jgi:ATP-dependent RNA helicase HelY
VHRAPDPTFAAVAFAWAAGEGFADVVSEEEMSGGDFVRTMKQLIDLVRQLALVAPEAATRRVAEQAADALFRGVVAASSTVEVAGDDPQG